MQYTEKIVNILHMFYQWHLFVLADLLFKQYKVSFLHIVYGGKDFEKWSYVDYSMNVKLVGFIH